MKSFLASVGLFLSILASATAAASSGLAQQAEELYAARDYSVTGIQNADKSAQLYAQLIQGATDKREQARYAIKQSEALYFVGSATPESDTETKKKYHLAGLQVADIALAYFNIQAVDKLTKEQIEVLKGLPAPELDLLAEAIYQRGINLGQWGAANGVVDSLSRWPELRDSMQVIIDLGRREIHEYGPFRVLGRGYYKIPALLGGSLKKAERYLATALKDTLVAGQIYSVNGYNTLYMAETLKELGRNEEAKQLLAAFVAADVTTLKSDLVPENAEAQRSSAGLLGGF